MPRVCPAEARGGWRIPGARMVVVRHITWVLRTKLRSSGKAILVLHHCAVSLAARIHFFDKLVAPLEPLDFLFPRGSQLWKLVRE